MGKTVLSAGIVLLIVGITLTSLASLPLSSHWVTFTVPDVHKSELVLNRNFEVAQFNETSCQVYLEAGNNITINAAISKPGTNRNVAANITFTLNDNTQTYLSFGKAPNTTLSWTAPKSGNYTLSFDNSNGSESKEVIVMVMKYWLQSEQYVRLVSNPLIDHSFVLIGIVACVGGAAVMVFALCRKTGSGVSNGNTQQQKRPAELYSEG